MLADKRLKDRYVVRRQPLARGGMGEVWRARDTLLERDVVVKVVHHADLDVDLVRRFRREALLTARLNHPGVPAVYDRGEYQGCPYLVLQWIDGITLDDLTDEQGALAVPWVCAIGAQLSTVLIATEQVGLVHRDLKPGNVILERSGAVKVVDFGLAVVHDDKRHSRITRTGEILGTTGYMAPEQVRGGYADHRADLYGLGGTLFHLLTAQAPFAGDTSAITWDHQLSGPPPRPSQLRPDIPAAVDDLVHALLAERVEDRPASAVEVYEALVPHVTALPPLSRVADLLDPVRAYAAVVGRQPAPSAPWHRPVEFDAEQAVADAERLFATKEFRAAARVWRQLAEVYEHEYGPDHPVVIDYRLRVAGAHLALGEHARALRLINQLEERAGPDHPGVQRLRQEIERSTPAG